MQTELEYTAKFPESLYDLRFRRGVNPNLQYLRVSERERERERERESYSCYGPIASTYAEVATKFKAMISHCTPSLIADRDLYSI